MIGLCPNSRAGVERKYYPYIIGWDYDYTKGLRDLLHEWALPDQ